MARFADLADFRAKHPQLADLLEGPQAERINFLRDMRDKVMTRQNLTPKMVKGMRKFVQRVGAPTHAVDDEWTDVEVRITGLYEANKSQLEFVRDGVTRGRIALSIRQRATCCDRLAALAVGEVLSAFVTARVVWVPADGQFPILEGDVEALSTVSEEHFKDAIPTANGPEGPTLTEVFDEKFGNGLEGRFLVSAEPEVPVAPKTVSRNQKFLPDFTDWARSGAFNLY